MNKSNTGACAGLFNGWVDAGFRSGTYFLCPIAKLPFPPPPYEREEAAETSPGLIDSINKGIYWFGL